MYTHGPIVEFDLFGMLLRAYGAHIILR